MNEGSSPPELPVDEERLCEVCARFGVARLFVFGAVSRGEVNEDSDLDLLYELVPDARLGWDIELLTDELSELFGRRVDLVSKRALHEQLRGVVLAQARPLYAA